MKKRGQITLKVLVELVVALALFSLFAYAGKVYGNGEIFQKAFVARDNAILIDSFYASSGNGYIIYPANVSQLSIDYKRSKVTVSRFKGDPLAAEYSFVPQGGQELDIELKNPEALIFGKTGDKIEIYTDKLPNLNKIKCIDLDTKGSYGKSLLIDADYRYTVPGVTISGLDGSAITSAVAASLFVKAHGAFSDITYTREGDIGGDSERLPQYKIDELADKADMIISIHAGDYEHKQNTLKVYYSDNPQSEKLACLILNRILNSKGMEFMGANVIPGSDPILKQGKVAVMVKAGNLQAEKKSNILANPDKLNAIGTAIYEGIEDYYG